MASTAEPEPASPDPSSGSASARASYLSEIVDELRWTFSERRGWLIGIAFNLAVAAVYVGYTHYRPHAHDLVRVAGIATAWRCGCWPT